MKVKNIRHFHFWRMFQVQDTCSDTLSRSQILVGMNDLKNILHEFVVKVNYPYQPLNPINVQESLFFFNV